jgi:hypothetical protein
VTFCLDDILLIDNRRRIEPAPAGVTLTKGGLDYTLKSPYFPAPLNLYQGRDGLWRVDKHQPTVQLASPGATPSGLEEQLELMGPRKVGQIELLEVNPLRLRLGNTWYFPTRRGEWVSLAVRKIRWEYTFYADGRWVTHVELNNAGGEEIGSLGIFLDLSVAWARGSVRKKLLVERFMGPVGRWSYLLVPQGPNQNTIYSNYLRPGRIRVDIGGKVASVGDMDRDGFDESQGCYSLQAHSGNCRFTVIAPPGGLLNPVFRVAGPWGGPVHVNSEGRAIRNITRLSDGSVLFCLAGLLERPTAVEITSEAPSYTSD